MIERVRIIGYRKIRELDFRPHPKLNILVGDNDAGKSTILEALTLALTGRINGRLASEEINPYWFNTELVEEFFAERANGTILAPPQIEVEVFLADRDEFQKNLFGAHNSEEPPKACAGVRLRIEPDPDYRQEIETYLTGLPPERKTPSALPVEYYRVDWRTFSGKQLTARPKELTTAIIDSRTIRSNSGMDIHLRQILNYHLDPPEKAQVSLAVRQNRDSLTSPYLAGVNQKIAQLPKPLDSRPLQLAMDQTGRGAWDSQIIPHIGEVPFLLSGQGQQAATKIALAMSRTGSAARVVMIEEPENHLSHTNLNKLLKHIEEVVSEEQQLFITTHSSYVLNRIGLDGLQLVSNARVSTISQLPPDTVAYFKKLPGYDTLRIALASRIILVEGPSDEIVVERFYSDTHDGRRPIDDGIDVISMRALSVKHCLRLVKALDKRCAVLRDNDGLDPTEVRANFRDYEDGDRRIFVGSFDAGATLEPQIVNANDEETLRSVLGLSERATVATWMKNNKTEAALRILESDKTLRAPSYISEGISFVENPSN